MKFKELTKTSRLTEASVQNMIDVLYQLYNREKYNIFYNDIEKFLKKYPEADGDLNNVPEKEVKKLYNEIYNKAKDDFINDNCDAYDLEILGLKLNQKDFEKMREKYGRYKQEYYKGWCNCYDLLNGESE